MIEQQFILQDLLLIIGIGYLAGLIVENIKLPGLLGMIVAGILMGPYGYNLLSPQILSEGEQIRTLALIIILTKAGLGMDRQQLQRYGSVVVRLGFLPCILEAFAVAFIVYFIMGWNFIICLVLGWIICAESPAVIVPSMLNLKSKGLGAKHGIPDLILAGGVISDVVAITFFGVTISMIIAVNGTADGILAVWNLPLQIGGGVIIGYLCGRIIYQLTKKTQVGISSIQSSVIVFLFGIIIVLAGNIFNYSGYLAIMIMGIVLLELNPIVSRRVREEVDRLWYIAQLFLFVLIGAAVNINIIYSAGLYGLGFIAFGFLFGRIPGVLISSAWTPFSIRERLFMGLSYIPKATVQAAIGSIPLTLGLPHGDFILAMAVLSIIFTAPIGAFIITLAAPRLLERGQVDPTKVKVEKKYRFLVALDKTESASNAFKEACILARQVDASIYLVHVESPVNETKQIEDFKPFEAQSSDIDSEIYLRTGDPANKIIQEAIEVHADYIFIGKINPLKAKEDVLGDISQKVVQLSPIPVILVN